MKHSLYTLGDSSLELRVGGLDDLENGNAFDVQIVEYHGGSREMSNNSPNVVHPGELLAEILEELALACDVRRRRRRVANADLASHKGYPRCNS